MSTQVDLLRKHFDRVATISPMEAHTVYKIRSLPRRIMDLKILGYQFILNGIQTLLANVTNVTGD